jgi:hypothetical protein
MVEVVGGEDPVEVATVEVLVASPPDPAPLHTHLS